MPSDPNVQFRIRVTQNAAEVAAQLAVVRAAVDAPEDGFSQDAMTATFDHDNEQDGSGQ